MPSHYSTIGFDYPSADEFARAVERLQAKAVPIATPSGTYFRWSSPSGAELWLQVDRQGELIGAHPHFAGDTFLPMLIESAVKRDDQTALDGAYAGWANPTSDELIGTYPVIIDCANYRQRSHTPLPAIATVQVAAFAYEASAFDSPEDFNASQTGDARFASQSFVPASALDDAKGVAEAFFCGHVSAAEARTNEITGQVFHWARVETYGATIDVVADPRVLPTVPVIGGVISGTFWLSARIDSLESRAGALRKFVWRLRNAG